MSRALDPEAIALLKSADHKSVYISITTIFTYPTTPPSPPLLEFEILSGLGFDLTMHLLQDGPAIAVPKLRLIQAFFVAKPIIRQYAQVLRDGRIEKLSDKEAEEIHRATAVALLMDAENLTAANLRKRAVGKTGGERRNLLLQREKWVVDGLLTSRLHRQTKSPTLWNHRRWILAEMKKIPGELVDVVAEFTAIVTVAGERHPRNYYAWCHARWLVANFEYDAEKLMAAAKLWAWKNYTDISGLSFLQFFMSRHRELAGEVVMDTLRFTESLQWRNESIWCFLRTVVTDGVLGEQTETAQQAFFVVGRKLFEGRDNETEKRVWKQANEWVGRYQQQMKS